MANPEPSNQFIRPKDIEFKFLFTKTLTETDMRGDLVLDGDAKEYLDSLPGPMNLFLLYSPNKARPKTVRVLKRISDGMPVLAKNSWDAFSGPNDLVAGEAINCWAGHNNVYKLLYLYMERVGSRNYEEGQSSSSSSSK